MQPRFLIIRTFSMYTFGNLSFIRASLQMILAFESVLFRSPMYIFTFFFAKFLVRLDLFIEKVYMLLFVWLLLFAPNFNFLFGIFWIKLAFAVYNQITNIFSNLDVVWCSELMISVIFNYQQYWYTMTVYSVI